MSKFHQHEWDLLPERAFRPRAGRFGSMTLEGGKGSSAPAPDPRLVSAQIKSMGYQDQLIQQMIDNNASMQPLQMEQLRFGLDSAKTAYEQSQEDRNWMLSRRGMLSGVQDQMVQDAKDFNTEDRRRELLSEADADVNASFSNARGQSTRAMTRMGINPNSGRAAALDSQLTLGQASARAGAANRVRAAARAEGYSLTDRANSALAGYPTLGMQATGAGAGYGASGLGLANSAWGAQTSATGAAGSAAGNMGQNATSMYGTQLNAWTSSQNAKTEAFGEMMGTLIGGGAMVAAKSDRRTKKDIVFVGVDPRTGINLYEFSYIDGDGTRYRGVMADEVIKVVPYAVSVGDDGFMRVNYGMLGIDMVEVKE